MGNYGHCLRCKRPLHTEESKKRGYGPTCFNKSKQPENKPQLNLFDKSLTVRNLKEQLRKKGVKVL